MCLATRLTRRVMEAERALYEPESFFRHDDERGKRTSAGLLAIPTVTVKHHHWFGGGFVANGAASASAREGRGYCGHLFLFFSFVQ